MNRYIDADKLQRDLAYRWYDAPKRLSGIKVSMLIDEQPTADVRENVKGEWLSMFGHNVCNKCGFKIDIVPTNFCPNCGADMRGDKS